MPRRIRYIPPGGSLVEVTTRTIQGRFLLRPCRELNQIVVGILARAARLHNVEVMGAVYLSNHFHLLLWVEDAQQLARFMNYHNGNLAREAGRLHDWREKFWSRRYQAVLVSEEEEAQVARLKYLLSHGAKEGLVRSPLDWPGVHCAAALRDGLPLEGFWRDRTSQTRAAGAHNVLDPNLYLRRERLRFSCLPCWRSVHSKTLRDRILEILQDIEAEATRIRLQAGGSLPARRRCRQRLLRQHPHSTPGRLQKRPTPLVHAFRKRVRQHLQQAYACFVAAYRAAAAQFRNGVRDVSFPPGSFPPAPPFAAALARPP